MNHKPIRTALVGVGGFGSSHLQRLRSQPYSLSCQLVAAADPCLAGESDLRTTLETEGCRTHPDMGTLLEREPSLEAVIISTPIPLHNEMVAACMERGLTVLLEKPPVPLIQQLDRLLASPGQEKVCVSFQRIASQSIQLAKQWILEGRIGKVRDIRINASWPRLDPYYARASWAGKLMLGERPVFDGPATNALAHVIHNLMFLGGETLEGFSSPSVVEGELYRARPDLESYDLACIRGTLASGPGFLIALAHCCPDRIPFAIEVRGESGWIRNGQDGKSLETSWGHNELFSETVNNPYERIYANLAEVARGVAKPISSLQDTRGYVLATCGALISSAGIHTVDRSLVLDFGEGEIHGYHIEGISALIARSLEGMQLFSELGVPWAVRGAKMDATELREVDLAAFVPGR